MTNLELFELASKSFSVMNVTEQVCSLVIFRTKVNNGAGIAAAWIDANSKVARAAMNTKEIQK
jgi:hypothetical protein